MNNSANKWLGVMLVSVGLIVSVSAKNTSANDNANNWEIIPSVDPQTGIIQFRQPVRPFYPKSIAVHQPIPYKYAYSNDPMMQQSLRMMGTQPIAPVPLKQWIQQFFVSHIGAQGYKYVKAYELPQVAEKLSDSDVSTYFANLESQVTAMGTEWINPQGQPAFALIALYLTQDLSNGLVNWRVIVQEISSPKNIFNQTIADFLYSQRRVEINPQWVLQAAQQSAQQMQMTRQHYEKLTQQSLQAHWQRMNMIQARGEASKKLSQTYSEISDINNAGVVSRNNIVDKGRTEFLNAINGESMVSNAETGETYTVPAGSGHYWMNTQGEYIATDNAMFDPRTNNSLNSMNWSKFNVIQ